VKIIKSDTKILTNNKIQNTKPKISCNSVHSTWQTIYSEDKGSSQKRLHLLKIEIEDIALNEGKDEGLQLHKFKDPQ
jgi:hypothetical protein